MNYEKNLKYFKSNDKHFYVGIGLIAFGAVLFVFANFLRLRFLPYQTMISVLFASIGAIVAFIPRAIRSSENEIDEIIARKTRGYDEKILEEKYITGVLSGNLKPMTVGDYILEGDNIIVRRGKDDRKCRSTVYCASALIFTKNGVFISQKTFSLIEESEEEKCFQFVYEDMDDVVATEEEFSVDTTDAKAKAAFLVFSETGGESVRVPIKRGAEADRLCEDINRKISDVKKQLSK